MAKVLKKDIQALVDALPMSYSYNAYKDLIVNQCLRMSLEGTKIRVGWVNIKVPPKDTDTDVYLHISSIDFYIREGNTWRRMPKTRIVEYLYDRLNSEVLRLKW